MRILDHITKEKEVWLTEKREVTVEIVNFLAGSSIQLKRLTPIAKQG